MKISFVCKSSGDISQFRQLERTYKFGKYLCLKAAVSFPLIDVFGNMRINAKHKL